MAMTAKEKAKLKRKRYQEKAEQFEVRQSKSILDGRDEDIREALLKRFGVIAVAARDLGVGRETLRHYIDARGHLKAVEEQAREGLLDVAESKMINAIAKGDGNMVRFYLERHGAHRGYGKKTEHTGAGGGPIKHQVTAFDPSKLSIEDLRALKALKAKAGVEIDGEAVEIPQGGDIE